MVHLIVTGSRPPIVSGNTRAKAHTDEVVAYIRSVLDHGHATAGIESLTHGAEPTGVDAIAKAWAQDNHVTYYDYPADWSKGKPAGPIRNRQMVRETIRKFKHDNIVVAAFSLGELQTSRGTANCVKEGTRQGLRSHLFRLDTLSREY